MSEEVQQRPAVLPYAAAASQFGVVIERNADGMRVIVPRVQGWRLFVNGRWVLIVFFGVLSGVLVSVLLTEQLHHGDIMSVYFLLSPVVFVASLGYELFTMWRRRVFLITSTEVCFGFVVGNREMWHARWARHEIGEIKMNPYDGRLLMRVTNKDLVEYVISRNREVTRTVAEALNQALRACAARPVI